MCNVISKHFGNINSKLKNLCEKKRERDRLLLSINVPVSDYVNWHKFLPLLFICYFSVLQFFMKTL